MRIYSAADETNIRIDRRVREWVKSGLLRKDQEAGLLADVKVGLKRTNDSLRIVLFVMGIIIGFSAVFLIGVTLSFREYGFGVLWVVAGVASFFAAGVIIDAGQYYRFGIEEAAAVASMVLIPVGVGVSSGFKVLSHNGPAIMMAACSVGIVVSLAVYLRYGYLYGAFGAIGYAIAVVHQMFNDKPAQLIASAALLLVAFVVMTRLRRDAGDEYLGDDYGAIEAGSLLAAYVVVNLQLTNLGGVFPRSFLALYPGWLYWATYVATWIIPAIGLAVALRDKQRSLLLASLGMAMLSFVTNKPYLGQERQAWDPIFFGGLLVGVALIVKRWLSSGANGYRHGYTATRLLAIDERIMTAAATASAALPHGAIGSPPATQDDLQAGGGRSGGAGSSGEF